MPMRPDLLALLDEGERELLRLAENISAACTMDAQKRLLDELRDAISQDVAIALLTALAEARRERRVLQEAFAGCVLDEAARLANDSAWMLEEMKKREKDAARRVGPEVSDDDNETP